MRGDTADALPSQAETAALQQQCEGLNAQLLAKAAELSEAVQVRPLSAVQRCFLGLFASFSRSQAPSKPIPVHV